EISGAEAYPEYIEEKGFAAFSYPYGMRNSFDQEIKGLLQSGGFRCAVSTIDGLNDRGTDIFALRRIEMRSFDRVDLAVQLSGIIGDCKNLARRLLRKS